MIVSLQAKKVGIAPERNVSSHFILFSVEFDKKRLTDMRILLQKMCSIYIYIWDITVNIQQHDHNELNKYILELSVSNR